jgi:hypothetical protein
LAIPSGIAFLLAIYHQLAWWFALSIFIAFLAAGYLLCPYITPVVAIGNDQKHKQTTEKVSLFFAVITGFTAIGTLYLFIKWGMIHDLLLSIISLGWFVFYIFRKRLISSVSKPPQA